MLAVCCMSSWEIVSVEGAWLTAVGCSREETAKEALYVFEAHTFFDEASLCGCLKARLWSGWWAALLLGKCETGASLPYV